MREITEYPSQAKSYWTVFEALEDLGYTVADPHLLMYENINNFHHLFAKDGKYYGYLGMDHFNTMIYSITLIEVQEVGELKDYCREE